MIEDCGGAEEFLAEELEALEVGEGDGEVRTGGRVVRKAGEARFFVKLCELRVEVFKVVGPIAACGEEDESVELH